MITGCGPCAAFTPQPLQGCSSGGGFKVTWDTEARWARVRFVVPGAEPRRVVERVERHASDTLVALWACARWLDERSRRVWRGETYAAVFELATLGGKGG